MIKSLYRWLKKPYRFELLDEWLTKPGVKILDVGCGNHAAAATKRYYPQCLYYGLDKSADYHNDEEDFKQMEKFYKIDLTKLEELKIIPDQFFDCIIMSHIIEHLEEGDKIILSLLKKLKRGGIIYIEFPSPHSVSLPSMRGTLNFYDDPSHVRIYNINELSLLMNNSGCSVFKNEIRRSWKRIILLPFNFTNALFRGNALGGVFWDITGFASYILASKSRSK